MVSYPAIAYRCGPLALRAVGLALQPENSDLWSLVEVSSTANGHAELRAHAAQRQALDALEAQVVERLRRLEESVPSARAFASSLERDLEQHRRERDALRLRLGLGRPAAQPRVKVDDPLDLEALRAAQEKLTYAHAEALPDTRGQVLFQSPEDHFLGDVLVAVDDVDHPEHVFGIHGGCVQGTPAGCVSTHPARTFPVGVVD
jgi:hypothetical protein